jgi:hypothetical protein
VGGRKIGLSEVLSLNELVTGLGFAIKFGELDKGKLPIEILSDDDTVARIRLTGQGAKKLTLDTPDIIDKSKGPKAIHVIRQVLTPLGNHVIYQIAKAASEVVKV